MNYFRCIGGEGGGETPLTFTKTSVVDKSQFPNIVFNEDYTNYDLLLFVFTDTSDNKQIEFLIPSSMVEEIFTYYVQIMFNRMGGNHYGRYTKTSNTVFSQYYMNVFTLVDVFAITCNKTMVFDDIYKNGSTSSVNVPISHNGITDNDLIFITGTGSGFGIIMNTYGNLLGGVKNINTTFLMSAAQYAGGINPIIVESDNMTTFYYFMVQGIKFT